MAKLSSIRTDVAKASAGVWVVHESGARFRVARWGGPEMERWLSVKKAPKLRAWRSGTVSADEAEALVVEAIARFVVLEWENVEGDDGTPIPYTTAKAVEILGDPAYRDLRAFLVESSQDQALYRADVAEDSRGN